VEEAAHVDVVGAHRQRRLHDVEVELVLDGVDHHERARQRPGGGGAVGDVDADGPDRGVAPPWNEAASAVALSRSWSAMTTSSVAAHVSVRSRTVIRPMAPGAADHAKVRGAAPAGSRRAAADPGALTRPPTGRR